MAIGRANLETRIAIINYNELGEIAGFANGILDNFVGILDKISETSTTLHRQNASYANEQASSTTEIVRTMEEVDALSKEIGTRSREVEQLALDMNNQIDRGVTAITRTMETMGAVKRSNAETIAEMRNLTEQINSIWEVVKIINGIAGQIKIIAFNATLEAASAGDAGKNFEIVASEIRRLADNTVASTSEIRSMIERIQGAADAMVLSSEDDTRQIAAAWDLSSQQETAFGALQKLSASTSGVAQEMHRDVSQQINAYGQVLETLKQISTGVGQHHRRGDRVGGRGCPSDGSGARIPRGAVTSSGRCRVPRAWPPLSGRCPPLLEVEFDRPAPVGVGRVVRKLPTALDVHPRKVVLRVPSQHTPEVVDRR